MNPITRRKALGLAAAGAATAPAGADEPAAKKQKPPPNHNREEPVPSTARPDSYGPRELFAVVSEDGKLQRGLHAVSARRLEVGVYEVRFSRDVRRGCYQATAGGHGYTGMPLPASA